MNIAVFIQDLLNSFGLSMEELITIGKFAPLAVLLFAIVGFVYSSGKQREKDAKERMAKVLSRSSDVGSRGLSAKELAERIAPNTEEVGSRKLLVSFSEVILKFAQFNKAETAKKLIQSGDRDPRAISRYILQRGAAMVIAPVITYLALPFLGFEGALRSIGAVVSILAGGIAVDVKLDKALKKRKQRIAMELPVLLDLLTIYVQAGQAFDTALAKASSALAFSFPTAAEEVLFLRQDLEMSVDRERTLREFGIRMGNPTASTFVSIIVQAERRGNPIAPSLRSLAKESRKDVISDIEKRAQKLPTLMQGPMFIFILPAIFLSVIGPAIVQIMDQFGKL